jgi:hypothetical protein
VKTTDDMTVCFACGGSQSDIRSDHNNHDRKRHAKHTKTPMQVNSMLSDEGCLRNK